MKKRNDDGSLLIDVLIGMAIVALIALIAVSSFGQFREKAQITGMIEDARALGLALEAEASPTGTYPTSLTVTTVSGKTKITTPAGLLTVLTEGNVLDTGTYVVSDSSFSFEISRPGFTTGAIYNSAQGGLQQVPAK